MATLHSTADFPLLISRRQCRHYAAACSSIDCTDLATAMQADADVAYAMLARLDLVQLTTQAVCYAAYANDLLGLDLSGDDVLAFWNAAFARRGLKAVL